MADIINVVIEELVRQRFELPACSSLHRAALKARSDINDRYFRTLAEPLSASVLTRLDAAQVSVPQQAMSG